MMHVATVTACHGLKQLFCWYGWGNNTIYLLISLWCVVQMDGEGYVPLSVVGRFNRVRALTQDLNLIKEVGMEQTPRGLYFVVIM